MSQLPRVLAVLWATERDFVSAYIIRNGLKCESIQKLSSAVRERFNKNWTEEETDELTGEILTDLIKSGDLNVGVSSGIIFFSPKERK